MKKTVKNIGISLLMPLLLPLLYYIFVHNSSDLTSEKKKTDFAKIEERGVLRVVTDYSAVGYFVKGDTIAGFNHDLLQLLEEYTPLEIEVTLESSLEKSIEGLLSQKYDIVARNIPITSDLKHRILFSDPITHNKQILVQRKQEFNDGISPVRSHLDLADKTLYVSKSSPAILRINNLSREIGDTIHYVEDDVYGEEQLAIMVAHKEIDFAVCDEKAIKKIAESQPELDIETMIGFTQFGAWAVSKDSPILLDSLNVWITKAQKTKKYNQIYKLYYD